MYASLGRAERLCRRFRSRTFITNPGSCFAKSSEQGLKQAAREVPTLNVRAHVRRKFRIESQQIFDRRYGFDASTEMSAGRRHYEVGPEESGYVHPVRAIESLLILALVEVIPEGDRKSTRL